MTVKERIAFLREQGLEGRRIKRTAERNEDIAILGSDPEGCRKELSKLLEECPDGNGIVQVSNSTGKARLLKHPRKSKNYRKSEALQNMLKDSRENGKKG